MWQKWLQKNIDKLNDEYDTGWEFWITDLKMIAEFFRLCDGLVQSPKTKCTFDSLISVVESPAITPGSWTAKDL